MLSCLEHLVCVNQEHWISIETSKAMPEGQIFRRCCQMNETGAIVKAETHDATYRCDTSPRQVASTNLLVWQVKIIVAATFRSDKISASSLGAECARICDKSLRQNLNQPMKEHQLVSRSVKFELVYISSLPKSIACSVLSQRLVAASVQTRRLVASCVSAFKHTNEEGENDERFLSLIKLD